MEDTVNQKELANLRRSIQKTQERMKNYQKKDRPDEARKCLRELQDLRSREFDLLGVKQGKLRKRKNKNPLTYVQGSERKKTQPGAAELH